MDWSYNEEDRRQIDTKNSGMDPSRSESPRGRTVRADAFVVRMHQLNSQMVTIYGLDLAKIAAAVLY
ncbi:unnamed protein product [Strongylus vulgaris]|uniref:Uncharacterized protein n=1 Tax=Strongylus vulgaris TaxID=40348 RepID=A0A3P7IB63_STRVU|nr:unnamed protein product [Strongylus vulgaris]